MRCSEKQNGCLWEGTLGELEHHLTLCLIVKEDCPYKCGVGVQRRHLEQHKTNLCSQRPFDCGHCDYRGTYRDVIDQHWAVCLLFPLACPANCGIDNIPRGQLQVHCDVECPLQEVACDFSHAGCKVRMVRQDIAQHLSDAAQQHMALVSRAMLQDKEREIGQLKQLLREKEQQHRGEMTKQNREHKEEMAKSDREHREDIARKERKHRDEIEIKDKQHKELVEKMSRLEGKGHAIYTSYCVVP